MTEAPIFSISIPTRNRPATFNAALQSVLNQSFRPIEIIVVDDGSDVENRAELDALKAEATDHDGVTMQWIHLIPRSRGHGHPFARNEAASRASGRFLATLDDDDIWTDPEHLAKAYKTLTAADSPDFYITDQEAVQGDKLLEPTIWLEPLGRKLVAKGSPQHSDGAYRIDATTALSSGNFAHLNSMIYSVDLYERCGGMNEGLRYEPDRDLFCRLVDKANLIAYAPIVVSRHFVPDQSKNANVSTQSNRYQKLLFQLHSAETLIAMATKPIVRRAALLHKKNCLKNLTAHMINEGDKVAARRYARETLGAFPGLKWALYTLWLHLPAGSGIKSG